MTRRVLVLAEGQTELVFVRDALQPHLRRFQVEIVATSLGGVSNWSQLQREIRMLCRDSNAVVTTLLDLYGLPSDTPGVSRAIVDPRARVQHIEHSINETIDSQNLRAHLQLHEFEAFLFVDVEVTASAAGLSARAVRSAIATALKTAAEPELVNDSPNTAPSKRIAGAWPDFSKTVDSGRIAATLGLERLRVACPHFGEWLTWLESLGTSPR
jgi:hypothetical protein